MSRRYHWLKIFMVLVLGFWESNQNHLMGYTQEHNNVTSKVAYFAGGCFWCMEEAFESLQGVMDAESGYTGGDFINPTYQDVSYKKTGHYEAIKVTYDPKVISYQELLKHFWINVDPTQSDGQFCDKGDQYLSAIFYQNEQEKEEAQNSKAKFEKLFFDIHPSYDQNSFVTPIIPLKKFYPAEEYHQSYYQKNKIRYQSYKYLCGRAMRLKELWKDLNI